MTPSAQLEAARIRALFALEVSKPEESVDLARAALLLGAEEEPQACRVDDCIARLDEMGYEARDQIRGEQAPIEALNRYVFEESGFIGNEKDYYDPQNSMLHRVLQRRKGIPITLAVIYIEIGRRAGLDIDGIGLPGHFVVRAHAPTGERVLVDPFNGVILDTDDCQERLDLIYGGQIALREEHLQPVRKLAIIQRMLGNLKAIYSQSGMYRRALAVVDRILLLNKHSLEERRDRGILLAQINRLPEAILETRHYLNLASDAKDTGEVREQLKNMQTQLASLN
jgi:regulator of sirC expression with transglutaminase-like and TPR domain